MVADPPPANSTTETDKYSISYGQSHFCIIGNIRSIIICKNSHIYNHPLYLTVAFETIKVTKKEMFINVAMFVSSSVLA